MELTVLAAGHCNQMEKVVRKNGQWKSIAFPATFVLIRHPRKGIVLFDTGYSQHNFTEMKAFPYVIYQWITPITLPPGHSAKEQLLARGIQPEDVNLIILSHLHADHIGGCRDFPNATFICSKREYEKIGAKSGFSALKEAFVPNLLPDQFLERTVFVEDQLKATVPFISDVFPEGYDLLGDGTIGAVFLPGHTSYQFGISLQANGHTYFFVSDACWTHEAYESLTFPLGIAAIIKSSYKQYLDTIHKLHQLHHLYPDIKIIPCHAEVRANE